MRKKYQSLTTELEKLRNYYTQKASTAEISKLREEILGYEKEYYQIENGIHELEKQIRNAEIKMLKK
jgi:archaellum component FlaC